jgi:hypothetical protein
LEKVQIAVEDPEQVKFWIAFYKTKGIDFFSTEVKEDFEQSKWSKKSDNSSVNPKAGSSTAGSAVTVPSEPEESFESAATGESGKTA